MCSLCMMYSTRCTVQYAMVCLRARTSSSPAHSTAVVLSRATESTDGDTLQDWRAAPAVKRRSCICVVMHGAQHGHAELHHARRSALPPCVVQFSMPLLEQLYWSSTQ